MASSQQRISLSSVANNNNNSRHSNHDNVNPTTISSSSTTSSTTTANNNPAIAITEIATDSPHSLHQQSVNPPTHQVNNNNNKHKKSHFFIHNHNQSNGGHNQQQHSLNSRARKYLNERQQSLSDQQQQQGTVPTSQAPPIMGTDGPQGKMNNDMMMDEQEVRNLSSNQGFFKPKKPAKRILYLTYSYSVFVSILCIVLLVIIFLVAGPHEVPVVEICISPDCVSAAAAIIEDIDENVEPCDDFYRFACNSFIKKNPIPDDSVVVGPFPAAQSTISQRLRQLLDDPMESSYANPLLAKVRRYYNSCKNQTLIENYGDVPLRKALNEIGGWPVIDSRWPLIPNLDLVDVILRMFNMGFYHDAFISIQVRPDQYNNQRNLINIGQGMRGASDFILKLPIESGPVQAYLKFMTGFAVKLGADERTAHQDMLEVLLLDKQIFSVSTPSHKLGKTYNKHTMSALRHLAPRVDWDKLFRGMFGRELAPMEEVLVQNPRYVEEAAAIFANASSRVVANYLGWYVGTQAVHWMGSQYKILSDQFSNTINGKLKTEPRWKTCMSHVQQRLTGAVSHLYLQKHLGKESVDILTEMTSLFKEELIKSLESADWIDPITRKNAIEKAHQTIAINAFPAGLDNYTMVDDYYKDIDFLEDNFFVNTQRTIKWTKQKNLQMFSVKNTRASWQRHSNAITVNAFHTWHENTVSINAGLLVKEFFGIERPKYLNFATVGFLAGHEYIHGFDATGRHYSGSGNLQNWWDVETAARFEQKAKCFERQYDEYNWTGSDIKVDGKFTLNENIADNGGLNLAYKAYARYIAENGESEEPKLPGLRYTPRQLFWINFARMWCLNIKPNYLKISMQTDPHAPNPFRTNIVLSNSHNFAQDFNCKPGTKMNPHRKCTLW